MTIHALTDWSRSPGNSNLATNLLHHSICPIQKPSRHQLSQHSVQGNQNWQPILLDMIFTQIFFRKWINIHLKRSFHWVAPAPQWLYLVFALNPNQTFSFLIAQTSTTTSRSMAETTPPASRDLSRSPPVLRRSRRIPWQQARIFDTDRELAPTRRAPIELPLVGERGGIVDIANELVHEQQQVCSLSQVFTS